jgi:hypothetical protein
MWEHFSLLDHEEPLWFECTGNCIVLSCCSPWCCSQAILDDEGFRTDQADLDALDFKVGLRGVCRLLATHRASAGFCFRGL